MIINEKYILDIDDEDDDGKIENNIGSFDTYPIEWKIVIHPNDFIDIDKLDETRNFEIDTMMDNIDEILDNVYFIERYKYEVRIYPFVNVIMPKDVANYLKSENGCQITNDKLWDFSNEINKIFDKSYCNLSSEEVAFAIYVDIKFALTDNFSYDRFCKSFGMFCGYFDLMGKNIMGVLHERFYVLLIHTDSKSNQPFYTFLQHYSITPTDIDNLCQTLFDIDYQDLEKLHKYDNYDDLSFAAQHRWLLKNQEIPKHITYFIKECKKHKALPQYKLSFGGYKDSYILLELDDKSFSSDDIPTLYEDFKNWLSNIPQNIYDLIVTDNYRIVNRNAWQRRHSFYVYILLNSDKLVGYYAHQKMNIDKYYNLSHYGNCLDIIICLVDKDFNVVGVSNCNIKNTIIKNCRTWLFNEQHNGLV